MTGLHAGSYVGHWRMNAARLIQLLRFRDCSSSCCCCWARAAMPFIEFWQTTNKYLVRRRPEAAKLVRDASPGVVGPVGPTVAWWRWWGQRRRARLHDDPLKRQVKARCCYCFRCQRQCSTTSRISRRRTRVAWFEQTDTICNTATRDTRINTEKHYYRLIALTKAHRVTQQRCVDEQPSGGATHQSEVTSSNRGVGGWIYRIPHHMLAR